ncbi:DUF4124 domain-containing protein [Stagnimonas aquatica]|uniref:DUF4124 domain-containing protein n=1 Tax=Stagnimonas aquatica TaxID=2689987 RepID=A0A3N0V174_9GAMM|nr:DUF4124 domain-containing protein [Stagnimonas aquatica]ROH86539.1 DUF4124 domain-containing protein [Stagnimonas aquatica]
MRRSKTYLLLLAGLPLLAEATVYRWVDANGQVHYSQTPPAEVGAEPQHIRTVPASPSAPAAAPPQTKSPPATAKPAAAEVDLEARAKRCSEARERIAYLEAKTARRLGVEQPDGSLARMTEEQFEERLQAAREAVTGNCGR